MAHNRHDQIVRYYDDIAHCYDADRFGSSYGRNIDAQERRLLSAWIAPMRGGRILDLGCGTGRFLDLASHGADPSAAMIDVARPKHPTCSFIHGDVHEVARRGETFDAIFCMHVVMHLSVQAASELLEACRGMLRPGGRMIFDAPSRTRRRLLRKRPKGWHGATSYTPHEVRELMGERWRCVAYRGLLFLPAHRFAEGIRPALRYVDRALGTGPTRALSSYIIYCYEAAT